MVSYFVHCTVPISGGGGLVPLDVAIRPQVDGLTRSAKPDQTIPDQSR